MSNWIIDTAHSEVHFKVKHLVISTVTGAFKSFSGTVTANGDTFEDAQVSFELDTNSIDTNQDQRDGHLKSAEFFNAEQFPKMLFTSTSFTKKDDETYTLEGNLTIKDVTVPISFQAEFGGSAVDFYGQHKAGFEINGKISRKEFGLVWNGVTEAGTIVVGDEVKLMASIQLTQQA